MNRNFRAGAEVIKKGGVHFGVWAPEKKSIDVVFFNPGQNVPNGSYNLQKTSNGYFEGIISEAKAGMLYKFRLNNMEDYYPDPVSRFQPQGPHGPSEVIDPDSFRWTDNKWSGIDPGNLIIYEMHIGTFTEKGIWRSAEERLPYLAETGINLIEVMPAVEFPGNFGWGYDGVSLFAPYHIYGSPDDFRSFINSAHNLGIGVIHDVVYNHLGPDGNYLTKYSEDYLSSKYKTDWGKAINYDDKNSSGVRDFYKMNAAFWIKEYHMDGLRLDATQNIFDTSEVHILSEINDTAREAAGKRKIYIVTENEPQNTILVTDRDSGGYGFDGMWNDDFHHTANVALTGKNEAYYTDYLGNPQEFISALKYGFLYQGQHYKWQKKRRGRSSLHIQPKHLVNFIQNHDQVANSARGLRIHQLTSPSKNRVLTVLLLLAPQTPMLFQGQEFGCSSPFFYFADHYPELSASVKAGRAKFLQQFRSIRSPEMLSLLKDPGSMEAFMNSKLDHSEVEKNSEIYKLHKDLISLRKQNPVFRSAGIDGAVLTKNSFVIRYFNDSSDHIMIINLGVDIVLSPAPEPLLAPPEGKEWYILLSSEDPVYGGSGTAPLEEEGIWNIPGNAAVVLSARKMEKKDG